MIYAFTHLWVIQILLLKHFSDGSYHFFGISPPKYILFVVSFLSLFVCQQKISPIHLVPFFFLANLSGLARIVKVTFCTIILQRINGQPAPVALCSLRRSLDFLSTSQAFFSVFFFKFVGADFPRIFFEHLARFLLGSPGLEWSSHT